MPGMTPTREVAQDELADYHEAVNASVLSVRSRLLEDARRLIDGDRNNHYGPPTQDFQRTAAILNALGYRGYEGRDLLPHDVAVMAMAIKLSRIVWSATERDHWTDLAGYAGCGYECVRNEAP